MSAVVDELSDMAECSSTLTDANQGGGTSQQVPSMANHRSIKESSCRTFRAAQRVGALVNAAHALGASQKGDDEDYQDSLDARIELLAEALEVQRDSEIDGVRDTAGNLLQTLVYACFDRDRLAIVSPWVLITLWWLYTAIIRMWAHLQFVVRDLQVLPHGDYL